MSKKDEAKQRARYTLEFKLEAVRLVKAGQEASVTARGLRYGIAVAGFFGMIPSLIS